MEGLLQVGAISSTHGVRGEVKVFPTTDDVKRYSKLKEVILGEGRNTPTVHIEGVKYQKNLYVTRENAVKLKKDEYFVADLIGLEVIDEEKNIKGRLADVMPTGANDVYVIELEDNRELLLPAIKDCIKEVDIKSGIMKVNVLDGLL